MQSVRDLIAALSEFVKDLPTAARHLAVLASVALMGSVALLWVTRGVKPSPPVWVPAAALGLAALIFLALAAAQVFTRAIKREAARQPLMRPAFHVGCRVGRRRLECGTLEVRTSGFPKSEAEVRSWGYAEVRSYSSGDDDHSGRFFEGAFLRGSDSGLFKHGDLYRELIASIGHQFKVASGKGVRIASIGISVPGRVHPDRGRFNGHVEGVAFGVGEQIARRVATSLRDALDAQLLEDVFGTSDADVMQDRIHLDNDARSAARWLLVEMSAQWDDFVCIFAGSGVGSGLVFQRQIFYGTRCRAGELGHVNLNLGKQLLLGQAAGGRALQPRHCSCGEEGYHFESLVGIGGLGHLAQVLDGEKLAQVRNAYSSDAARWEQLCVSSIHDADNADRDGMLVLRSLAALSQPPPRIPLRDPTFAELLRDERFGRLIRSAPISEYLDLVTRQYARLFGTGIAALSDVLDISHVALCGTIPEFLQNNHAFTTALRERLPGPIAALQGVDLEVGSMVRWGWRGAALLSRDPGYMIRRSGA